ncbi:MAG: sigma-70 family RNA polymerase sigma factor [Krumholzibacteria bacterium]|nr:sigma-70 family RNA polymerase sigma factor [Candidatus Krumholzibacteria bacterium]
MTDAAERDVPLTILLERLAGESPQADAAREQIFTAAYAELRGIAQRLMRGERANHTLDPTALVNEAYVRLVGDGAADFASRAHFFGIAVRAMRQVLIHHARAKHAEKRGGDRQQVTLVSSAAVERPRLDLLELEDALTRLSALDERMGRVVELRFFGGLTAEEVAVVLGISRKTVQEDWKVAKIWLRRELG